MKSDQERQGHPEKTELERLRAENAALRDLNGKAFRYIREKVDALLEVIGTSTLKPEELDDRSLLDFDPIGIVTCSFQHVMGNLRETNRKLHFASKEIQAIFDTVGAALLVLDPQRRVLNYNQKTRELMLGHDDNAHGRDCRKVVCRLNDAQQPCIFERVISTGREQHFQDWPLNERNYTVVGRPMRDETGQITHVVIAYTDVTARRKAEEALLEALAETQEANTKIHGILRSAADGMLITDANGSLVLLNRRAEELLDYYLAEQPGEPKLDQLPHQGLVELLSRVTGSGEDTLIEDLLFPGPGSRDRIFQARITALRSTEGKFRGCITFLHEVTREREIDQMKSEFVSTAAHELRTPLASIIGYADLLLSGNEKLQNEHLADYLSLIQDKAERLADIVGDLLDISRIESGEGLQLNLRPCRLDVAIHEVVSGFRSQSVRHAFTVQLPEGENVEVLADRFALLQVLENVLSNAVKYSPAGGTIRIEACEDGSRCHIAIHDQGVGMTPDQLDKIFDKFYRADATDTAISGTGLGMTIVRHLVEAQNGAIAVESQPNRGTRVQIQLPLASAGSA